MVDVLTGEKAGTKWQRVLYKKQPFPDNYTDETFLEHMRLNTHIQSYNYIDALQSTGSITRHLSIITVYVCVFVYMIRRSLGAKELLSVIFGLAAILYGFLAYFQTRSGSCEKCIPILRTGSSSAQQFSDRQGTYAQATPIEHSDGKILHEEKQNGNNQSSIIYKGGQKAIASKVSNETTGGAESTCTPDMRQSYNNVRGDTDYKSTVGKLQSKGVGPAPDSLRRSHPTTTQQPPHGIEGTYTKGISSTQSEHDLLASTKTFILLLLLLLGVSPVLTTLTASVSTDSIYSMAAFMFVLNIVRTDYRVLESTEEWVTVSNSPSLVDTGQLQTESAGSGAQVVSTSERIPSASNASPIITDEPIHRIEQATDAPAQGSHKHTQRANISQTHSCRIDRSSKHRTVTETGIMDISETPVQRIQRLRSSKLPELSLAGINEAMFASVCLASRLHSALEGFALLAFAVEIFVLLPYVVRSILGSGLAGESATYSHTVTIVVVTMTFVLLVPIAPIPALLTYVCVMGGVTFVAPALLIRAQKYKRQIIGPWDEAVVTNVDDI